ncbi:MAG TPA: sigma-54 dependent transcriptional regulator, partial [Thermodesulfovibrionales bacterium]|nr:sigma-54 dependent transcriptional regulator [Thermodesulfovibrionales bacterium]
MKGKGRIFLVDDDDLIVSMLSRALKNEGYEVRSESTDFRNIVDMVRAWSADVALLDIRLPGRSGIDILGEMKSRGVSAQVIMLTSDDNLETAVKCMKIGAADYLTKPFNIDEVKIVVNNIIEKGRLKSEVGYLRRFYLDQFEKNLIGESGAMRELRAKMDKIAHSRVSSILITGDSGTGKELVARCLHRTMSGDADAGYTPFIAVNCSALPETLLESELFGYEKGAFTDAKTEKKGIFELASGGAILLDEIGDMRLDLQSKLLRVLEERAVRRIGGREELPIDVAVIATTNKDIPAAVEKGEFRKDLFYRLNIFSLHIPPLRERSEDIPALAGYFLNHFASRYKNKAVQGFSPEVEKLLCAYSWPGNVRELKNVIERIVVLENTEVILPEHLPKEILRHTVSEGTQAEKKFVLPEGGISLDDLERDLIVQALEKAKDNKTLAAKLLNISRDSLRYQLKKF